MKSGNSNVPPQIYVTCGGLPNGNADNNILKFHGQKHNPTEHLWLIFKFYGRRTNNDTSDPVNYLFYTTELCLERHAGRWFSLVKNDLRNWENFREFFEPKYWSREVQRGIEQRMEVEKCRLNGKFSQSEYFAERVIALQAMQPPLFRR